MVGDDGVIGAFLPAGTRVRYGGLVDGGPEYGVVVHCWRDDELGAYDCYVAFFGTALPDGRPSEGPYVLHYASTSFTIVDVDGSEASPQAATAPD